MGTRTDIHRPSSETFDPQHYVFTGHVKDNAPDYPGANNQVNAFVQDAVHNKGMKFSGVGGPHHCNHCGTRLRWAALMIHIPTGTLLYIGETCLDGRFEMTKSEFKAARDYAKLCRELQTRKTAFVSMCDDDATNALVYATYAENMSDSLTDWEYETMTDIAGKAKTYSNISDAQLALLDKILTKANDRLSARVERINSRTNAHIGSVGEKVAVKGIVRWDSRPIEGDYGMRTQLVLDTDQGTVVWWATGAKEWRKGEEMTLVAKVKRHSEYKGELQTVVTYAKVV